MTKFYAIVILFVAVGYCALTEAEYQAANDQINNTVYEAAQNNYYK